ncbi:MAG: glutaredoxin family protein [Nanoarchaeota archaeon]
MKVTLYTAPACPFCIIVKKVLERNGISFTAKDISKDKKAKEEMKNISGQENVPVTDVDGNVIVGYNIQKLKKALKIE